MPNQTIIGGASAILGMPLKITAKGSSTAGQGA